MPENQDLGERIKDLEKKKKKLVKTISRNNKSAAKARAERKKVNDELRRLKGKGNAFKDMTPDQAMDSVKSDLDNVKPSDIYPADLEREFDKIDRKQGGRPDRDVVDLGQPDDLYVEEREFDLNEI